MSSAFMRFYAEFWQRPNYLVENLKMLSCPELSDEVVQHFKLAIPAAVENRREAYLNQEPFQEFLLPAKIKSFAAVLDQLSFDKTCLLGEQSEQYIAQSFGFTPEQSNRIEHDLIEAIRFQDKETSDEAEGEADDKDKIYFLTFQRERKTRHWFPMLLDACMAVGISACHWIRRLHPN